MSSAKKNIVWSMGKVGVCTMMKFFIENKTLYYKYLLLRSMALIKSPYSFNFEGSPEHSYANSTSPMSCPTT